jgi:hypothetical protein
MLNSCTIWPFINMDINDIYFLLLDILVVLLVLRVILYTLL